MGGWGLGGFWKKECFIWVLVGLGGDSPGRPGRGRQGIDGEPRTKWELTIIWEVTKWQRVVGVGKQGRQTGWGTDCTEVWAHPTDSTEDSEEFQSGSDCNEEATWEANGGWVGKGRRNTETGQEEG